MQFLIAFGRTAFELFLFYKTFQHSITVHKCEENAHDMAPQRPSGNNQKHINCRLVIELIYLVKKNRLVTAFLFTDFASILNWLNSWNCLRRPKKFADTKRIVSTASVKIETQSAAHSWRRLCWRPLRRNFLDDPLQAAEVQTNIFTKSFPFRLRFGHSQFEKKFWFEFWHFSGNDGRAFTFFPCWLVFKIYA